MTSIEFINPKSRQYYKLNKLLSTLRGFLFWKNSEGYYLGCNDNFADFVNLNSNQDIKR